MACTIESDTNEVVSEPYQMFAYSIRNGTTRKYYERRLKKFFDFINLDITHPIEKRCTSFVEKTMDKKDWALNQIISFLQFQKSRVERGQITAATLSNFVKPIKLFCEMSDIEVPWKKITRGLPRPREAANDRAPTVEEIQKLVEYPDRRIKAIVYTMCSSGIRLGAWDFLKWKHIIPLRSEVEDRIIAAKILVYAGDIEEYFAFVSPEAYSSLKEWMDFRASYGEKITEESWVMRDLWQTTNINYGAKWGLAKYPKKMKSSGVKRIIERALWEQGLRQSLTENNRRHEWKGAHGFRKFYKTRTEQVMRPINVEITMGHNIGISGSYYRPTEREVLEDYLKAVDLLTIEEENRLHRKIKELSQKDEDSNYIIKGKLAEKDKQIDTLMKKQEKFELLIQSLIDSGKLKPV